MKIPVSLSEKYKSDPEISSATDFVISKVSDHISSNRMVFFQEYTDHSVRHIEDVLGTGVGLATEISIGLLTPEDGSVMSVAASLHDVGMHITKDGFESLISPFSLWRGVPTLDSSSWNDLWINFLAEASRFDGRKLVQLFGEAEQNFRVPPIGKRDWEDRDYLLVGEFLRRHHARLAHEIALYGLPGKDGEAIQVCLLDSERKRFLADIGGLVARSHGVSLRDCVQYLKNRYDNVVDPRRVHAVYLMVLLRVADYLQIQSARAPSARTDVSKFRSPFSEIEWNVHQSVRDVHNTGSDPEALVVNAEPGDVHTYLRLSGWLAGFQQELDTSWAVLGETYGLQKGGLSDLGLRIRRIRSNIDSAAEFAKKVAYAPRRLAFEAANADLLKLLIGPLYGNDVSAGFRELIQNAVDAVRELDKLEEMKAGGGAGGKEGRTTEPAVEIAIDLKDDLKSVTVVDRGVGMNLDVIENYFLRAGASFRRSEAWRKSFEDDQGNSTVLRAGRFGVGALAAFLIGDEIDVTTRHRDADPDGGWHFRARIDDDAIEVSRISAPIGTTIRITVPSHLERAVLDACRNYEGLLDYSSGIAHYFGSWPVVGWEFNGDRLRIQDENRVPIERGLHPSPWRSIETDKIDFYWNYDQGPTLACNGIIVAARPHRYDSSVSKLTMSLPYPFSVPKISASDPNGVLPINLQRTEANLSPYVEVFVKAIVDDLVSHAIISAPYIPDKDVWWNGIYSGFVDSEDYSYYYREIDTYKSKWAWSSKGYFLADPLLLCKVASKGLIIGIGGSGNFGVWGADLITELDSGEALLDVGGNLLSAGGNRFKGIIHEIIKGEVPLRGLNVRVLGALVTADAVNSVNQSRPGRALRTSLASLDVSKVAGWFSIALDEEEGRPGIERLEDIAKVAKVETDNQFALVYAKIEQDDDSYFKADPSIAARWVDLLGDGVIPFDREHRSDLAERVRQIIPTAYAAAEQSGTIDSWRRVSWKQRGEDGAAIGAGDEVEDT